MFLEQSCPCSSFTGLYASCHRLLRIAITYPLKKPLRANQNAENRDLNKRLIMRNLQGQPLEAKCVLKYQSMTV